MTPGGEGGATVRITVAPRSTAPPQAGFTMTTPVEAGRPVTFTNQSSGAAEWRWTFEGGDGPTESRAQTPPPRTWPDAGRYTVTLEVRRGDESSTVTHELVVTQPPVPLVVGDITGGGVARYDTSTDYTFTAIVTRGEYLSCAYTIEGVHTDCVPTTIRGERAVQVTHRFASTGPQTIALRFETASGPGLDRSLTIQVDELQPPRADIEVIGATHLGSNSYVATVGTPITLDASGTTGEYDILYWQDGDLSAPQIHSTRWSPRWDVGDHGAILSVISTRQGTNSGDAVNIRIVPEDTTGPTAAMAQADLVSDPRGPLFTVTASDPETVVTGIDFHGLFRYACRPAGSDPGELGTQAQLDATVTPWFTARVPMFTIAAPGFPVSFTMPSNLCPAGQEMGPRLQLTYWAVVWNSAGLSTETPHNMVFS
jgi:PKD repeat protein